MNVLSLFDGISCGQIALNRLGYNITNYFSSEIKKTAINVTQYHYPNTQQLGDIRNINGYQLPKIDLLIGGSPCKGISKLNRNQNGLKHKESSLFYEYERLRKEVNPTYFILENTHGNKEATNTITEILGVKPISINSRIFTAQNRPRYYWTNIEHITIPKNRAITTKDIFDFNGDLVSKNRLRWLLSKSGQNSISKGYTKLNPYPIAGCITANGHKKWNENYVIDSNGNYRYLSRHDLELLQTLPEGYTNILSYEDAYDVIGDGWTVDVIAHILSFIKY